MEYLDPVKQKRYKIMLLCGYGSVAIAIAIGCLILLWISYGYNYNLNNGRVTQNGMLYLSSQPNPANIYINGKLNSTTTNTRLIMNAGTYHFTIADKGYRSWNHVIQILGGEVEHYDYPLLFPQQLISKTIYQFKTAPEFASQSPNQQYLVVPSTSNFGSFKMFNLNTPKTAPVSLTLPSGLLGQSLSSQTWQVVGWANDNQHLLLEYSDNNTPEFIELDTQHPSQSINLNQTFNINPSSVSFNNLQYNSFYFYNSGTKVLSEASIGSSVVTPILASVLAYKSYGTNDVLYATSAGAPPNDVVIELYNGTSSYFVRYLPIAQTYLLNMAGYNGNIYMAVGDSSDHLFYLYENPLSQISNNSKSQISPFRALLIANPNYESFAPTAQFIMVENVNSFVVYNFDNQSVVQYSTAPPLEAPQTHAQWMDGDRIIYVSNNQLTVADYDNTNRQTLTAALPNYQAFFSANYNSYFSLANSSQQSGAVDLKQTSLIAAS